MLEIDEEGKGPNFQRFSTAVMVSTNKTLPAFDWQGVDQHGESLGNLILWAR